MNIIDEAFGPYFIQLDANNYTLFKRTKNVDAKGNPINICHGYFSNTDLVPILKKLVRLSLMDKKVNTVTLKTYIAAIQRENQKFKEIIEKALL
jgi:hypothetical protein